MVGVEEWAEIRRLRFVLRLSVSEISRRTGRHRATVRRALGSQTPPAYSRPRRASKLDPYREEVLRLLRAEPTMPGTRVRELLVECGYRGGKSILDDFLREVRPLIAPPARTYQRTVYRPGELGQFDLWQPRRLIPVGFGQQRRGYVVTLCVGYCRVGEGALVFSKEAPDLLWGMRRCLWRLGGVPQMLVWDREGAVHAGGGRPTDVFAGFCGQLGAGWHFCQPADPEAKGLVERLQGYMETNFEPGRVFLGPEDFQAQLDGWFEKANRRTHRALRARPVDLLGEEREAMRRLPAEAPDVDRRFVCRVMPDPFVRVDTCDYSLDPRLVGRRVEVRVTQREVLAVALDGGEVAARHRRSFARHRTITDLAHLRLLRAGRATPIEPEVEARPLARYDALIS